MTELNSHEERFNFLMERDSPRSGDNERKSLFYILAEEDLYSKINKLYDFEEKCILPDSLEDGSVDLSGGEVAMVRLAYHLYNGYELNLVYELSRLDNENFEICMKAIRMRFNH